MNTTNKQRNYKLRKIESLNDHEHVLLRPNAYVGSTQQMQDKLIIFDIEKGYLINKNKVFSEGFYRIFDEVLDNAFDEARRCYAENFIFNEITVDVNSKTNEVIIIDSGRGFIDGEKINTKTELTNIETALTKLRAGSNFKNEDYKVSIIGMNGIGVSATNILSEYFAIETQNSQINYKQSWYNFEPNDKIIITNENAKNTFTKISFIPRKNIFKKSKWDFEILFAKLLFKQFQILNDEELKNIKIKFYFDDELINLDRDLFPPNSTRINVNKNVTLILWPLLDPNMSKISFVNSSQCVGFHQTYIEEFINTKIFENEIASQFYRTMILLNVRPKYVQFQEQNKNRFVSTRNLLEEILPLKISKTELTTLQQKESIAEIKEMIYQFENKRYIKKIKKIKSNAFKFSDKFIPSLEKENLFLVEGQGALGSISQKRNPKIDSMYALKGKIKNVRTLEDLTNSVVIVELINILGLNLDDGGQSMKYKKIIIATDADEDGKCIASLIINFFHKWFPKVILNGKLFILNTPLISYEVENKIKYLYSLNEEKDIPNNAKHIRYLKGLGSLSCNDWEQVFKKLPLSIVNNDHNATKMLELVFGEEARKRKRWLLK